MKKINNGKRLAFDLLLMAFLLMTIVPVFAAETNNIPSATQQKQAVTGIVTDNKGEVIPGVNVMEKGTTNGVITDVNGHYTITVTNENAVLAFSFIGYVTQEIVVGDRTIINVSLKEDAQNLGEVEVVAIAYGNQDKRMLTSAVSSIDNKELIKSPATSITNLLAGALPGVSSVQTTGQPGKDAAAIYVRGVGSLNDSQSKP